MAQRWADLHTHTVFSDGSYTPEELVVAAKHAGLDCVSVTDHDATDAVPLAAAAGRKHGIEVVPGVELSTCTPSEPESDIHILGYFIQWDHETLRNWLALFRKARTERVRQMLRRLADCGINLRVDGLFKGGAHVSIGRMHVARLMHQQGYVQHLEEAFKKYLRAGKPAYVPKLSMTTFEAIRLIQMAGGVAVLAHPVFGANSEREIKALARAGLSGMEAWHSRQTPKQTRRLAGIARRLDLVPTGGTDCHGGREDPGAALGAVKIPYEIVEKLKCRAEERTAAEKLRLLCAGRGGAAAFSEEFSAPQPA